MDLVENKPLLVATVVSLVFSTDLHEAEGFLARPFRVVGVRLRNGWKFVFTGGTPVTIEGSFLWMICLNVDATRRNDIIFEVTMLPGTMYIVSIRNVIQLLSLTPNANHCFLESFPVPCQFATVEILQNFFHFEQTIESLLVHIMLRNRVPQGLRNFAGLAASSNMIQPGDDLVVVLIRCLSVENGCVLPCFVERFKVVRCCPREHVIRSCRWMQGISREY